MRKGLFWAGAALCSASLLLFAGASYNAGALPTALYGAWLMARALRRAPRKAPAPWRAALATAAAALISLWLVWQGVCVALIFTASAQPPARKPDAIIVLGAGFWGDTLSDVLRARLDEALALHRRIPGALLVLSGGQGLGEQRTEASLMREYLLAKGVPESSLLLEPRAMNTVENFANSRALLDARFGAGGYTAAFLTSEFHLYRSRVLAQRAGLAPACWGADTPWYLAPAYITREAFAILYDLAF